MLQSSMSASSISSSGEHGGTVLFPAKLHFLLETETKKGHDDVISWCPDGKSFKVHDKAKFASKIMPAYFGSSKYRSFQKNLNLWEFKTASSTASRYVPGRPPRVMGECFHPLFIRDRPDLCIRMQRVVVKKGKKSCAVPSGISTMEPDKTRGHVVAAPRLSDESQPICNDTPSIYNRSSARENSDLLLGDRSHLPRLLQIQQSSQRSKLQPIDPLLGQRKQRNRLSSFFSSQLTVGSLLANPCSGSLRETLLLQATLDPTHIVTNRGLGLLQQRQFMASLPSSVFFVRANHGSNVLCDRRLEASHAAVLLAMQSLASEQETAAA